MIRADLHYPGHLMKNFPGTRAIAFLELPGKKFDVPVSLKEQV
jgi:hypothetical protein